MRSHLIRIIYPILILCAAFVIAAPDAYAEYAGFSDPGTRTARSGGGAADGLVPVNAQLDGGKIPVGASAQVVVRFRNDGVQDVEAGIIRLYPSSTVTASVSMNQCSEQPLPSGAECALALTVKGLQAGPWRVEMLMSHSGRTRLTTATMSGQVESTGEATDRLSSDIEMSPGDIDFGSLESSQTLVKPVTLRNITSTPINVSSIYIDTSEQAGYALKTECSQLQAGQACIAIVSWSPKVRGRSSGVLVVEHSGPAGLSSAPITGTYSPPQVNEAPVFPQAIPGKGLMVASQSSVDFGTGVDSASTITVSLVNAGDAPMNIQDIRLSGADNGLNFKDNGCISGMTLEPVEACPLTLTWSPTREGDLSDDVQILHDGARGVLVLPINGTASAPVNQDQQAIDLTARTTVISSSDDPDIAAQQERAAAENTERVTRAAPVVARVSNPKKVLDGYKITSFSAKRAIINGPGGSRIVFNNERIMLGGVPWMVTIQPDGIEFDHEGQRVLLLFDRSLSSVGIGNRSQDGGTDTGEENQ